MAKKSYYFLSWKIEKIKNGLIPRAVQAVWMKIGLGSDKTCKLMLNSAASAVIKKSEMTKMNASKCYHLVQKQQFPIDELHV